MQRPSKGEQANETNRNLSDNMMKEKRLIDTNEGNGGRIYKG